MTDHVNWEAINNMADGRAPSVLESAHLAACADCSTQLAALRALLGVAQQMPSTIDPPVDAWAQIRRAIDAQKTVPMPRHTTSAQHVRLSRRTLGAAAVLLIAVSSAVTTVVLSGRRADDRPPVRRGAENGAPATLVSDIGAIEQEYLSSASTLRAALDEERPALAPATVALVERNLRIIDDAIAEARAALMHDPASAALRALLRKSHEQKIDFLRRTTALLHEA